MSGYGQPDVPNERRPTTITASICLLVLVAALIVADQIMSVHSYLVGVDVYEKAVASGLVESESFEGFGILGAFVVGFLGLVAAVALIPVALLIYAGKRWAPAFVQVIGALSLCCPGVTVAGAIVGCFLPAAPEAPGQAELERRIENALPPWYGPVNSVVEVLLVLSLIAAMSLLAMPASTAFFRRHA